MHLIAVQRCLVREDLRIFRRVRIPAIAPMLGTLSRRIARRLRLHFQELDESPLKYWPLGSEGLITLDVMGMLRTHCKEEGADGLPFTPLFS